MKKKCLLFVVCLTLLSCSEAFKSGNSENLVPPPNDPNNPNQSQTLPEMSVTEDGNLTLPKSALNQEFLLQASFIDHSYFFSEMLGTPAFNGIQSRVVYFAQNKKSLFLMESSKGNVASEEIPSERILTEFEIAEDKNETLTFDFNTGMKKIFRADDWNATDGGVTLPSPRAIETDHTFVKTVSKNGNRVFIQQIAQMRVRDAVFPVEVRYYLEPYQTNAGFTPIKNDGFERVGYFETNAVIRPEYASLRTYITRWDTRKPIVYHLSANTPKEYVEAVKEGILYWNRAFGAEIVQAAMAPEGISAPNPDYNIVQWITNHSANWAYADAQMDPRTGEILHAQIFFASSFPLFAGERLKKFDAVTKKENSVSLGLRGFSNGLLCNDVLLLQPAEARQIATSPKEVILTMTREYIRHVIAHEVGHTLGLRHNFAASQSSEMLPSEVSEQFENYIKTGAMENTKLVSSSVMDYLPFKDRIPNGNYVARKDLPALPYDRMAIQWGYYNQPFDGDLERTLFCTDGWADWKYVDCRRGDTAMHPILGVAENFKQNLNTLPQYVAQMFYTGKTYFDEDERYDVDEVELDAGEAGYLVVSPLEAFINLLKGPVDSIYINRKFRAITDTNAAEVEATTTRWFNEAIEKGGGLKALLTIFENQGLIETMKNYKKEFNEILALESFAKNFSDREISYMRRATKSFFSKVAEEIVRNITDTFAGESGGPIRRLRPIDERGGEEEADTFRPIADLKALEEVLGNWAEYIITDGAEAKPAYDSYLRLQATGILRAYQGPDPSWQKENQKRVAKKLLTQLEKRYGKPFDQINPQTLSDEKRALYETELQILIALNAEIPIVDDVVENIEE